METCPSSQAEDHISLASSSHRQITSECPYRLDPAFQRDDGEIPPMRSLGPQKMIHLVLSLCSVWLTGDKSSARGKGKRWVGLPLSLASKLFGWIILSFETSFLRAGSICTAAFLLRIPWDVMHAESLGWRNLAWCYLVNDKHWVLSEWGIPVTPQQSVNLIKLLKIYIH